MEREMYQRIKVWLDAHFDELVEDICAVVRMPSVSTYEEADAPFGKGCLQALHATLALAERYGFDTHNEQDLYGSMTLRPGKDAEDEIAFWGHLDVVPAGEGWQLTQPFAPIVRDGYLIGRGADDNKGPALGVLYVLRAFEELGIHTRHGLRLFVGCDEEHGMRDVQHFAAHHPASKLTLIPDCGFPVCYGEKGIIEANIVTDDPLVTVTALCAGVASNIVPDQALIRLKGLAADKVQGEWVTAEQVQGETCITARGLSGHSAFPQGSVNAIHQAMGAALASGLLCDSDARAIAFLKKVNDDCWGTALGIAGQDEISGETTCTGTMASLREDGRAVLHLNIRYCIRAEEAQLLASMEKACRQAGCTLERIRESAPNYFPRESPVVEALTRVYRDITAREGEPFVMGGGTYARKLNNALAFGLGGLPKEETTLFATGHGGAHQPDEGLHLANFKEALLIFAMGVLEVDKILS